MEGLELELQSHTSTLKKGAKHAEWPGILLAGGLACACLQGDRFHQLRPPCGMQAPFGGWNALGVSIYVKRQPKGTGQTLCLRDNLTGIICAAADSYLTTCLWQVNPQFCSTICLFLAAICSDRSPLLCTPMGRQAVGPKAADMTCLSCSSTNATSPPHIACLTRSFACHGSSFHDTVLGPRKKGSRISGQETLFGGVTRRLLLACRLGWG